MDMDDSRAVDFIGGAVPDPSLAPLIAIARQRILDFQAKINEQVDHYIGSLATSDRSSQLPPEAAGECAASPAFAARRGLSTRRRVEVDRHLALFAGCLDEIVSHIDTISDEKVRSSLMVSLSYLLETSNNAGGLVGGVVIETKKSIIALARERKTKNDLKRIRGITQGIYLDLKKLPDFLDKTPGVLFKTLRKMDGKKYTESKRRSTERYIENILETLRLNRILGHRTRAVLQEDFAPLWLDKEQSKTAPAIFEKLREKYPANYPESRRQEVYDLVARQKVIDGVWAEIAAKRNT